MIRQIFVAGFGIIAFCVLLVGGKVEGRLAPVSTLGEITQFEVVGDTHTRLWGTARRLRDCTFERLEWRLGVPGHSTVAVMVFEEGTHVRPRGEFHFGPWHVQLTPIQLFEQSYAVVFHRCHPLWLTETLFHR